MKNIILLANGVDFTGLLDVLKNNTHLIDEYTFRTKFSEESPHREVHDIILRCPAQIDGGTIDDKWCVNYPAMDVFGKELMPHLRELMDTVGAIGVGRVILTILEPEKQVYPHEDQGAACDFYHRFHLVLQSDGGVLKVGDEEVNQRTGEVYWLNNSVEHSVENHGELQRVVLIVDLELLNVSGEGSDDRD